MDLFIQSGWKSRWIETYGKAKTAPMILSDWKDIAYRNQDYSPIDDKNILGCLSGIVKINGDSYSGCWDVIGWKEGQIVFAESKRVKKDSIRQTQVKWLSSAFEYGLTSENFLVVQWDFS
jgi:hypothetical protein